MEKVQTDQPVYEHLEARPHPWRRQLYLRGRNMTVGQLVPTMNANKLSPEEAAEDMDLPPAQVQEALAYYLLPIPALNSGRLGLLNFTISSI